MSDLIKIAGLWRNERDGKVTLSGPFGSGARIIVTKNKYKREDSHPDYVVFLAPSDRKSQLDRQGQGQRSEGSSPAQSYSPPPPEDDIPF